MLMTRIGLACLVAAVVPVAVSCYVGDTIDDERIDPDPAKGSLVPAAGPADSTHLTEPKSLSLSSPLELDLPIYGSWFNQPSTASPLSSSYYDSLAVLDVCLLPVASLVDRDYTGLVDSVRTRNPDWIPIWHQNTNSVNRTSATSGAGSYYRERYDLINGNDRLRIWAGADPAADWWLRDIHGERVPRGGAYGANDMVHYGAEGLADAQAKLFIKHLEAQDNLRPFVGVLVDDQNLKLERWTIPSQIVPILDVDREGEPDTADVHALVRRYVSQLPDAYRRASGRDDFLVLGNGTAAHDSSYAWLYDGCTFEQPEVRNYYPRTSAGRDDIIRIMSRQSDFYSNVRVNPPLMMFLSYADSNQLTNEALAAIAGGVAMFSWRDANRKGHLDRGLAPLMDLMRPTADNHLELGARVPGSVAFSGWDTETVYVVDDQGDTTSSYVAEVARVSAKFYDGADTSYVSVDGFNKLYYPWPYLVIPGTDTLSFGSVGIRKIP
jgi:hypothetical protein